LWATATSESTYWPTDWDADLTQSEQQHFLRRIRLLSTESTQRLIAAVKNLRAGSAEPDERAFVTSTVREWLAQG
jgi:hypothetical protein